MAHYTYTVPKVPWLTVYASSFDRNQREATFSTSLWISDVGAVAEEGVMPPVDIYPDKHSYKPGDTAHVLIATHAPGAQVLVTTEGQQVYTWSLHPAAGDSLTVDIPIEERFEPNFFLNVTFVKNRATVGGLEEHLRAGGGKSFESHRGNRQAGVPARREGHLHRDRAGRRRGIR